MNLPEMLKGPALGRLVQGAAIGVVATVVIGFGWGGWMLGNTAAKNAEAGAEKAVVAVLTPICVDKFQKDPGAEANLASLKAETFYQRASFIEKGGWAVLPGNDKPSSGVARSCAEVLASMK